MEEGESSDDDPSIIYLISKGYDLSLSNSKFGIQVLKKKNTLHTFLCYV